MRALANTRRWRRLLAIACFAILVIPVVATASSARPTGGGGTVIYRLTGDWTDFDIQQTSIASQNRISKLVYEGMLAYAPDRKGKTHIVGDLAQSWTVTPTSITFKLRKGPKCTDGTPVTPSLVLRSWRRMLDVSTTLPLAFGGSQGGGGKPPTGVGPFSVSANTKKGTVTFRSTKPNNEMIYGFLGGYGGLPGGTARVVCPEGLNNPDKMKTQMFGTGPYELVEATHLNQAVLKLRRDYTWGPNGIKATAKGLPDTIIYKVVPNDTTAANLFLTGQLDAGEVSAADGPRLVASGQFNISPERSKITTTYLAFNSRVATLQDVTLRTALTMAFSAKSYDQAVNGPASQSIIVSGIVTPAADCYDRDASKQMPRGTIDQARALLLSKGYTYRDGQLYKPNGDKLTIQFWGSPVTTGAGGEYVASQWKKLGVDVKLQNVERAIWGGSILKGDYETTVLSFGAAYPSPGSGIGWISGPFPPDGSNLGVPRNTAYENEIALAKQTLGKTSCKHWTNAARMLVKNRWFIPVSARTTLVYIRKGIGFQRWNSESQEVSFRLKKPIRP